MRSSSVKTLVVTVSTLAVISATAVTAEARPTRPTRTTVTTPRKNDGALDRAVATMKAAQRRIFNIVAHALVGPPLPAPEPNATSNTADPTFLFD